MSAVSTTPLGASFAIHPAALDLPHAPVESVASRSSLTPHSHPPARRGLRTAPSRAPGLQQVLREVGAEFVLLDGTLAECDRVSEGRAGYSHRHRRHGVTVRAVIDPDGQLLCYQGTSPFSS